MDVPAVRAEPAGDMLPDEAGPIDIERALGNIKRQLQEEPQRYRLFGLWWWLVKPMLAERFDTVEMPFLGSYDDPEQHETVAALGGSPAAVLIAALAEYGFNARFSHPSGKVEWGSELVTLYDPDVEG